MNAAIVASVIVAAAGVAACGASSDEDAPPAIDPDAALLGGETTVFDQTNGAYSKPANCP